MHTLREHREPLVDHRADHPRGVEATAVVDHDRRLADLQDHVVGLGERLVGGLLALDDLDERHLVDGAEEVQADEVRGPVHARRELGDRQRRGVGAQQCVRVHVVRDLGEHLLLEARVLEDRLDDEVAPGQVGRVGRRRDPGQHLLGLRSGQPAAIDRLGVELLAVGLPLGSGLGGDVLEHDLHPGAGARVGDARAHHAGAEDGDLGRLELLDPLGTELARVDRLQVEEERLRHVLEVLADQELGQVAALDPAGGVDVDARSLDRRREDRALGGIDRALGLLAEQRRERREERRELRRLRGAAGHPVARAVPGVAGGLGVVAMLEDPRLRGRQQVVPRCHDLVDQTLGQRVGRLEPGALEQHVHQPRLQAEHPDDAGHAATTREQAEGRLGQPDQGGGVVDDDPVVAGQGDLEATAERGAVDRGHHGPRVGLEPAQVGLGRLDVREQRRRVLRRRLDHQAQVGTGEEGLLGARHDHTRDVVHLVVEPAYGGGHRVAVELVHRVRAGGRVVEGEGDDAVGVALVAHRGGFVSRATLVGRACRDHVGHL